jgi:hypothetical protein
LGEVAEVEAAGVEVDTTVVAVLLGVESRRAARLGLKRWVARRSPG